MLYRFFLSFLLILGCFSGSIEAKAPPMTPALVNSKLQEIMKSHAKYKTLTPELIRRILNNYLEELDPSKTYFVEDDIKQWTQPSDATVETILKEFNEGNFQAFNNIYGIFVKTISRRHDLEKQIDLENLPKHVSPEEFKDLKWAANPQDLLTRLMRFKALQMETVSKMSPELKEKTLQRIEKRQTKYEEEILTTDAKARENLILSDILKAAASSLDTHTAYFTPEEARQFMINVQQRLFGIGAQLRDDINGFTVVKIIEGGPAAEGKELKPKDRIIAVNGEPVVGMDIVDAVELIRGGENTPVTLTVVREAPKGENKEEEKLDIVVKRGEVVLKETRYEATVEPYGDGDIAYIRLYSFYQDPDSSSSQDLANAITKLKKEHHIKGMIFDLRYNSGGMLAQAVEVTGLFIKKGIVVSIKDDQGNVQHLRNINGTPVWDGPLIVLINRSSASASEIVAQTLQDYGRALIVGDDHSYGKGSFQTFTLDTTKNGIINPQGEYKVTRGRYYTVSGKTPQMKGVESDIIVNGALSESEMGEKFSKYPLDSDTIPSTYDDDLADIPLLQREKIRLLYKFDLQTRLNTYQPYLEELKRNSTERITENKNYQNFLKELKKKDPNENEMEQFGQNDLQLAEAYNIMKDLIFIMQLHPNAVIKKTIL